jgi:hypothetical protein
VLISLINLDIAHLSMAAAGGLTARPAPASLTCPRVHGARFSLLASASKDMVCVGGLTTRSDYAFVALSGKTRVLDPSNVELMLG